MRADDDRTGNGHRFAARPIADGGTPAAAWHARVSEVPVLDLAECRALTVIAPHPDDETLGFGATAATLAARGIPVRIVCATDGGGAYPGTDRHRLEQARRAETCSAVELLGLRPPIFLGLPDGALERDEQALADAIAAVLADEPAGSWCAATWRGDGHPDHEAVGRAAAAACAGTRSRLLEYPVWMWHWASPDDDVVPWHRMSAVPLDPAAVTQKRAAVDEFRSQLAGSTFGDPVLPPFVVQRLLAVGEVVFG